MNGESSRRRWGAGPGLGAGRVVLWLLLTAAGALLYHLPDLLAGWLPF